MTARKRDHDGIEKGTEERKGREEFTMTFFCQHSLTEQQDKKVELTKHLETLERMSRGEEGLLTHFAHDNQKELEESILFVRKKIDRIDTEDDTRIFCKYCNNDCCKSCSRIYFEKCCVTCGCLETDKKGCCEGKCDFISMCVDCRDDRNRTVHGVFKRPKTYRYNNRFECCDSDAINKTDCPGCDLKACWYCAQTMLEIYCTTCGCHVGCDEEPTEEERKLIDAGKWKCDCPSCKDGCFTCTMCMECGHDIQSKAKGPDVKS